MNWVSDKRCCEAIVQQAYASDPKFKKYVQQVEKCLNSFDDVHEWADCIAFLKQLLKVRGLFHTFNARSDAEGFRV